MYGQEMGYEPSPEHTTRRRPTRRCSVTAEVLRAQQQELLTEQQQTRDVRMGYDTRNSQRNVMRQIPRSTPRARNPYVLSKAHSMACVVGNVVDFESDHFQNLRREQSIRRNSANRSAAAPRAA